MLLAVVSTPDQKLNTTQQLFSSKLLLESHFVLYTQLISQYITPQTR